MAAVLFTVAVLAVFVGAIVYTAFCARAAVAAEYDLPDDVASSQGVAVVPVSPAAATRSLADGARDVDEVRSAA